MGRNVLLTLRVRRIRSAFFVLPHAEREEYILLAALNKSGSPLEGAAPLFLVYHILPVGWYSAPAFVGKGAECRGRIDYNDGRLWQHRCHRHLRRYRSACGHVAGYIGVARQ